MKIIRNKKASKLLSYYANNFGYRPPYQLLIDATFCQAALQNKVAIEEQLKKYLQCELRFFTTQCIILEAENLGDPLVGAVSIVKKFTVFKCGHEGKPIVGSNCVKELIEKGHFIVATQDRSLQNYLRQKSGHALMYLHRSTPVLDPPSNRTKAVVSKKVGKLITEESVKMKKIVENQQILAGKVKNEHMRKKKKSKGPNPLSCKKKKSKQDLQGKKTKRRVKKSI